MNWTELGAPQIPDLLREIQEDQPDRERDKKHIEAWRELRELVFPEGIIDNWDWGGPGRMMQNDLPHQVVPFLIELLRWTTSKSTQSGIIELLWQLCTYSSVKLWVGEPGSPRYETFTAWVRRLKDGIRRGLPLYQELIDDSYPTLKKDVSMLLEELNEED